MTIGKGRTFRPEVLCATVVGAWFAVLAIATPSPAIAQATSGLVEAHQASDDDRLRAIGLRLTTANADKCRPAEPAVAAIAASDAAPARPVRSRCSGRFIVSPDKQLNAWANGRDIAVTGKMMQFAGEDDALAFVVAHELAHNILAHAERLRGISSQFIGPADAQRIKDTEIEADTLAIELIVKAGFNPEAAQRLLAKMAKRGSAKVPATYPSMAERIRLLETLMNNPGKAQIAP